MKRNLHFFDDHFCSLSLLFLFFLIILLLSFLTLQLLVQQQVLWNGKIRPRPLRFWQRVIITSYVMLVW